ncbi:CBS domain-containing protein [Marinobacter sediminum]|uniref:CBS domain-containing protein n=1 Tax=Marinobacter sediminum TaxID=256323 RepID=UPI0035659AE8
MTVEKIMSTILVTVEMDDTLRTIKEIFDHSKFHHLLVVESGKLFGVISDRDLLKALSPYIGTRSEAARDLASLNKKAHQIMTRTPITLQKNAQIDDAIAIFLNNTLSCIPIVDSGRAPVGIISWRDILKSLLSQDGRPAKNQQ